jgi:hypothetical protein
VSEGVLTAARRGLTGNGATTAPDADDRRLVGRTYAIPFQDVWQASLELVGGGLRRWEVVDHDDQEGLIRAVARGFPKRLDSELTLRIVLDPDAQTRVDGRAHSPAAGADLGVNARRLGRFFRALDRVLDAHLAGRRLDA